MANDGLAAERNAKPKVIKVDGKPRICLFALRRIQRNEEIRYDYGDKDLPWRKVSFLTLSSEISLFFSSHFQETIHPSLFVLERFRLLFHFTMHNPLVSEQNQIPLRVWRNSQTTERQYTVSDAGKPERIVQWGLPSDEIQKRGVQVDIPRWSSLKSYKYNHCLF